MLVHTTMAWGSNKPQPSTSTFRYASITLLRRLQSLIRCTPCPRPSQVLPLIVTLAILGCLAWVVYQIYVSIAKIQDQASRQMGSKNVVFTREGVRVGVRHVENEDYVDATQSWVVKAWNLRGGGKEQAKSKQ